MKRTAPTIKRFAHRYKNFTVGNGIRRAEISVYIYE